MIAAGIMIPAFHSSTSLMGFAPGMSAAGFFMSVIFTTYLYLDNPRRAFFPNMYTHISIALIVVGIAIATYTSLTVGDALPYSSIGSLACAYGCTILECQIMVKYRPTIKKTAEISLPIIPLGIILFTITGFVPPYERYIALGIIPLFAGCYLLASLLSLKNYEHWRQGGYFSGPPL